MSDKRHPAQDTYDAQTKVRQDLFIKLYPSYGTLGGTATACSISRQCVQDWNRNNVQGFSDRLQDARVQFGEYLEDLALKRCECPTNNGRTGSDVLLLGLLNANVSEKFRPRLEVKHELGDRVLSALQRANQLDSANAGRNISSKMLPGNDAEYKELPQLPDSSDSV